MAEPAALVYLPLGHNIRSAHRSACMLFDVVDLNFPDTHAWHWGCVVTVPATLLYLPGGHLVCAVQESVLRVPLLLDTASLKNPAAHVSHFG